MSASVLEKNEVLEARAIKYKSVPITVKVVGNATPASKVLSTDLPGVAIVIAQGQTANLPSGVTTVTPADATGLYSVVLDKEAVGTVTKVLKVEVTNVTSTQTAAISLSNGYIVIDIDSAADLTAANSECIIFVDYLSR
jgi:uncharacterized iron-regulated membrane protein